MMILANNISSFDVVIVGLGPVGATLANILGQYAINTLVLEKEAGAYHLPRAVAFDDEVMRVFQSIGLSKEVNKIVSTGADLHFLDGDGNILVDWVRPKEISANGWFVNNRFHQPELEKILRKGLKRFGCVHVELQYEVVGLFEVEDGVTINICDLRTGNSETVKAAYVIGCDGARSFTRTNIKSEIDDLGFHEPWLVVDLLLREPEQNSIGNSYHYCDPERSATHVFLGAKRKRWEFRLNPGETPEEIIRPENVWRLLSKWIGPDKAKLERAVVYTFHASIAKLWRRGRLMIAGDAAHQTPPFMGQGMCSGIRDVANIGWKLNSVIRGGAPCSLLDTYQSEREPHVRAFIGLTVEMGKLINRTVSELLSGSVTNPDDGPQKLTQLRPNLGPGLSAGRMDLTGCLFPQPRLENGLLLDEKIGLNSAILIHKDLLYQLSEDLRNRITHSNLVVITEFTTDLADWFDKEKVGAVLIRPDRYILGTATSSDDVQSLVESAFYQLGVV